MQTLPYFITNNQLKMYLKHRGLKLSRSKADLLNEFSATHVEMLPEMFWKMKNFLTRVNMTQLQNQSSDSDVKNTFVEESFEVLFVPEEDIQNVN